MKRMHALKTKLKRLLLDRSPVNVRVNSSLSADPYAEDDDTDKYLSNTLSIAFEGMLSSSLLSMMGSKLCTSAGAACHSAEAISVSEVLRAVHCPLSYAIGHAAPGRWAATRRSRTWRTRRRSSSRPCTSCWSSPP